MSRNVNSFFSEVPASVDVKRSRFKRRQNIKTTFNAGYVIPFYLDEVLPGDTFSVDTAKVVRMPSLITPIMDNIYLDTYYFFVPNRLVWDHWKEFMGENTDSAWISKVQYTIPQIETPSGGWANGTIADYLGIPTKISGRKFNALPFRAYALICNEWFRDENLTDPIYIETGDSDVTGTNGFDYVNDCALGGVPFKAAKYHDYFTSALPAPQKGPDIPLPISGIAPVGTDSSFVRGFGLPQNPLMFGKVDDGELITGKHLLLTNDGGTYVGSVPSSDPNIGYLFPMNLVADLNQTLDGSYGTINDLRTAFQLQKFYEKDARGGTRYTEIIRSHFGVVSPDSRLQRPEYLGGSRIPINVHQIMSTAETENLPQANPAAYSLSIDTHSDFTKSFTEHGFVMGLMVARYDHTYQQGVERMFSRSVREDYYFPVFANLGEQAIKNKEIYLESYDPNDEDKSEEVFGYQEAWAEYRYKPNRVSGYMRSNQTASLDVWHLADNYNSLPSLSDSWIREDYTNINRTLAVTGAGVHQFFADIVVDNTSVRVMPLYSVPGLIDHH